MYVTRLVCSAVVGLSLLAACGDDHSHDDDHSDGGHSHGEYTEACQAIIDACHDIDDGEDEDIVECHGEIAHENDDPMCRSERDRCIALCEAAAGDGGHHDDGGHDDSDHGEHQ